MDVDLKLFFLKVKLGVLELVTCAHLEGPKNWGLSLFWFWKAQLQAAFLQVPLPKSHSVPATCFNALLTLGLGEQG